MKKILNAFSKEKVQKLLFLAMIVLVFGVFMFSIFKSNNTDKPNPDDPDINNPDNPNPDKQTPDKPEPEKYKAPCDNLSCSIIRHFYSLEDDAATQEMSLIQIGSKYQMSRGITYKKEDDSSFDVCATLSGTVTNVQESPLYGNVITIDHGNNIKSEYLGVSKVLVKTGDTVKQGQTIASSGQAEYDKVASNHVHFRVSIDGKFVDPEDILGKEK
ncbi:MAG: M23 family metallopeptidase [Bacilli bacterium]|nr:M23 family metallopeptidase [Bacilli bacterium]